MKPRIHVLAAALFCVIALPGVAAAANAYATGSVNMRAGPGTRYPVITTVRRGSPVTIHGCLSGWSWCDTSWHGARGWVSGRYLEALYQGRRVVVPSYGAAIGLPIIGFEFGNYWDHYYRDRPFYRRYRHDWDRHVDRHHHKRPRHHVERRRDHHDGPRHHVERRRDHDGPRRHVERRRDHERGGRSDHCGNRFCR